MQVICTDGTTFACESYELTEFGVVCYSEEQPDDADRYDRSPDQIGYVPHDRLWYVLPDGVAPNVPGATTADGPAPGPAPRPGAGPNEGRTVAPPVGRAGTGGAKGGGQEANPRREERRLARPARR